MTDQLTYPEMADAVRAYFKRIGNEPRSSADVYHEQFADQDKVRFQLVFSNMALKPPHDMVKLQDGAGTKGVRWRLREPSDPPFVEPIKIPRAKRTVEIARPLAAPAPPVVPSRIAHRDRGMVAETPAHIRAQEHEATVKVEHHALGAPPNNALAAALSKAIKDKPKPAPVAQFANLKVLNYELAPDARVVEVPMGVCGTTPKAQGEVVLSHFEVEADAPKPPEPEPKPPEQPVKPPELRAAVEEVIEVTRQALGPGTALPQPEEVIGQPTVGMPVSDPNGSLTPGNILDLFLGAIGPMFKSLITEAVKEALHAHPQVPTAHPAPPPAATISASLSTAPIAVPPYEEPQAATPRHRALMPGEMQEASRTRLPKITVIGLPKPQWEFDVKDRFAKWLDIKTVHVDTKAKTAGDMSRNSDFVIIMADYSNHAIQGALSARNIAFELCRGGPSKLDDRLREIIKSYQGGEQHAA